MQPGAPLSIWVWADAPGNSWHVRSTTPKGDPHRITGRISAIGGSLTNARGYMLEGKDAFQAGPREVTLSFETNGVIDGVDFTLTGGECLLFEFFIDGAARPTLVNIGPRPHHPGSADFRLCR
jgi:hypothetical protein